MSTGLLGEHPLMHGLRAELANYANQTFPVLIEGESGTGKEIAACHHLHRLSRRKSEALLVLNCSSINPMLIEASLFGHARGAFTGAVREQSGYFGDSGQGTLFLDEIGELPLELQGKLLRVLENGEYQRLGETRTRQSNARIIAATNRNLHDEIRQGRFRADLYHRLSVFKILIPPLRDRGSDSLLLLDHFREQLADKVSGPAFNLDRRARERWLDYPFPGNVRELRNIVARLTARHPGQTIGLAELAQEMPEASRTGNSPLLADMSAAISAASPSPSPPPAQASCSPKP